MIPVNLGRLDRRAALDVPAAGSMPMRTTDSPRGTCGQHSPEHYRELKVACISIC